MNEKKSKEKKFKLVEKKFKSQVFWWVGWGELILEMFKIQKLRSNSQKKKN